MEEACCSVMRGTCKEVFTDGLMIQCSEISLKVGKSALNVRHCRGKRLRVGPCRVFGEELYVIWYC